MTVHDGGGQDLHRLEPEARRELLNAYIDGELPADRALAISAWLDENPGALREVEHLRHLDNLLALYEDEAVPEGFAGRVFASVGIEHQVRRGRVLSMAWYRRPIAIAAAVLVAVGAGVIALNPFRSDSRPAGTEMASVQLLEEIPADYLEHVDLLVDTSVDDELFEDALEGELEMTDVRGG